MAKKKTDSEKEAVTVTWGNGSREYSLEIHGENFMELAEQFAKKMGGTIE